MSERIPVSELAGHCNEATAWRILEEVSRHLMEGKQRIVNPYIIDIGENGHFALEATQEQQSGFDPHEVEANSRTEASTVWSLGATLFYIVMGRCVMNGKGGEGQSETSKLPFIRSEWPEMSELVQQCLQFEPANRPTLQEIHDKALQNLKRCHNDIRRGPKIKSTSSMPNELETIDKDLFFWPERMHKS